MLLWASRDVQHALCCLRFYLFYSVSFSALVIHPTKINKERERAVWKSNQEVAFNCHLFFFWFMLESQIVPNITVPQKVFLSEPKATISYSHRVFSMSVFTISSCAQLVIFQQLHWAMCTNVCAYSCRKKADVRQNVHRLAVNQYKHQLQQFFEFAAGV